MSKKTIKKCVCTIVISMFILMFFMAYGVFASGKEKAGKAKDVTKKDIFAEPAELVFWWYGEEWLLLWYEEKETRTRDSSYRVAREEC